MKRSHHADRRAGKQGGAALAVAAGAALALVLAPPAFAHTDGELRGGFYNDAEEGFVGGGLLFDLGDTWNFNPNLEWVFVESYDYFTVNGDFHKDLNASGDGPALIIRDRDFPGGDDTSLGLNLFGGLGAKRGAVRPFGQLKFTASDNSETSLALGLRF